VNFLGLPIDQEEKHEPVQAKAAHVAKSVDTAIVSCNAGATALNLRNGNSANPMPVSLGDSVFWVSPPTFTLSGLPAGFCTNGNPTGGDGSSQQSATLTLSTRAQARELHGAAKSVRRYRSDTAILIAISIDFSRPARLPPAEIPGFQTVKVPVFGRKSELWNAD